MTLFPNRLRKTSENSSLWSSPVSVFCVFGIASMLLLLLLFFLSKGELISQYFFYDIRDTGMDFFHSIEYVRGRAPYEIFDTLYPPLANLLFLFFYCLVPRGISEQWPNDFYSSTLIKGSYLDLRTYQAPLIIFLVFTVLLTFITLTLIVSFLKHLPYKKANLVAFCVLFSPGFLMALERGNILLLVLPLTMFYVFNYKSENKLLRELALISLALSAGLKLYPAFFGILLLREKKYKEAVRAVIYGILSVLLPLFFFKEGLSGIPLWLNTVFKFGETDAPWLGTSFASILHRVALYFDSFFGITLNTSWFSIAGFLSSGILLIASLFSKKEWQSVLAITMAIIFFQSQWLYIYSFLSIPFLLFLIQEEKFNKKNVFPFFAMMLFMIHLPLFYTADFHPNIIFDQLLSLVLSCWCIFNAATSKIQKNQIRE